MAKVMKAAVVRQFGKPLVIEDVPVPGLGELLVKVMACGVCHTDLHAAEGDGPVKPVPPFIPGHEIAGIVAALGPGVTDFREGDPVGVAWLHDACLHCEYCETGWETLCEHQHDTGYSCDGGFAEYVIASAAFTARLPVGVDFVQMAPILCAGVTTYKGLKETEARPGEWVAISGIGGLGHVAIQYAKAMGLKVLALDVAADKLALARATEREQTRTKRQQSQRSRQILPLITAWLQARVLPGPPRKSMAAALLRIALGRIDLGLRAILRHVIPFEVTQVRVHGLGADRLSFAGGSAAG